LIVATPADVDRYLELVHVAARRAQEWLLSHEGEPLESLRQMKFSPVGFHPIEGHGLNLIEQLNQTWTYAVALAAARQLLGLHPDARGFKVAPGAHMSLPLDIMSIEEGLVGAETFAAVHPRNNGKLSADLAKLMGRHERHRYVLFSSPAFPGSKRLPQFERGDVQVWSLDV
jgi:hypothetical protein